MNLADHLLRQFSYDQWANREVLNSIRKTGTNDERSLQLMSHILAAERVWLERLMQRPQSVAVWPKADLTSCQNENEALARLWIEYLSKATDFDQSISYKNSKGETWTSSIGDVLTHVLMHSAYHRGQIASHMRACGQTPAYTDFIHAVRQGLVK
jgi:uncharacterized damage-inducible protein DinB